VISMSTNRSLPLILVLAACLLAACHPQPRPQPPVPDADAATPPSPPPAPPSDVDAGGGSDGGCVPACAHLKAMKCKDGLAADCVEACVAHDVPGDRWDTDCLQLEDHCGACRRR